MFIKNDFGLDSFEQGVVVAAVPIGAVAGAAFAGPLADTYGRRRMIIISAVVFIVGAAISSAAGGLTVLTAARVLIGIAIGIAGSVAMTRMMATLLFGTGSIDGITLAGSAALFVLVALAYRGEFFTRDQFDKIDIPARYHGPLLTKSVGVLAVMVVLFFLVNQ